MTWLCPRCAHEKVCMINDFTKKTGWAEIHNCIQFVNSDVKPTLDFIERHIEYYGRKTMQQNTQIMLFHAISHEVKGIFDTTRQIVPDDTKNEDEDAERLRGEWERLDGDRVFGMTFNEFCKMTQEAIDKMVDENIEFRKFVSGR